MARGPVPDAVAAPLEEEVHGLAVGVADGGHRCISAATGFPNFNRLINHYRVEDAKRRLRSPEGEVSILNVALDCGFASVGPFNRAFRDETGMTPRAWRAQARD